MATYSRDQIIQIITQEANALGVPPALALAVAEEESGLNAASIGDGGHSVGLFQLNDQGEGHGMTDAQREDPVTNARIALTQIANVMRSQPNLSGGALAAAAQRPADRVGYAQAVDAGISKWDTHYKGSVLTTTENTAGGGSGGGVGSTPVDMRAFASQNGIPPQWLNDPQIGPLLEERANNTISPEVFAAQLQQTRLYQTTPQSQRIAMAAHATDPATLQQVIRQSALSIHNQSTQLGVTLTPAQEINLATQANAQGWTNEQVRANLAANIKNLGQATSGEAATDLNSLKSLYQSYALPVAPQTLQTQLQSVLSGAQTLQGLQSTLAQQAKTLYATNPQLAAFIDGDNQHTTSAWAAPYLQHASTLLGLNPNSINLTSPMWQKVLNPATDPKTGSSTNQAMSLDQWDQQLRTDPTYGYDGSQNAISTASAFANSFAAKLTGSSI